MPRVLEADACTAAAAGLPVPPLRGEARTCRPHAGSGGSRGYRVAWCAAGQRLASLLPRGSIRLRTAVARVRRTEDGRFLLDLPRGERLEANAVVLACPAHAAAALARDLDPGLAGELDALEFSSCATVHLAYRREDARRPLRGYGFFVPRTAGLPLLACSYVSEKHPERARPGDVLLRAFVGGARDPRALEGDDAPLIEKTHDALARILDLRGRPVLTHVQRHPRAMPHFRVGDAARLARMASQARSWDPWSRRRPARRRGHPRRGRLRESGGGRGRALPASARTRAPGGGGMTDTPLQPQNAGRRLIPVFPAVIALSALAVAALVLAVLQLGGGEGTILTPTLRRLPLLHASLNGTSGVLLVMAWFFIRRKWIAAHVTCVGAASLATAAFLGSYLYYHAQVGSVPYQGTGWLRRWYSRS